MPASPRYIRSGDTGTGTPGSVVAQLDPDEETEPGDTVLLVANSGAAISTPPPNLTLDPGCSRVRNSGLYLWRRRSPGGETAWTITPDLAVSVAWAVIIVPGLEDAARDVVVSGDTNSNVGSFLVGPTAAPTSQADCFGIVLFGSSRAAPNVVAATALTGGFGPTAPFLVNRQTNKAAGANVGLAAGFKDILTPEQPQSQVSWSNGAATVAILAAYRVAAVIPPAGGGVAGRRKVGRPYAFDRRWN